MALYDFQCPICEKIVEVRQSYDAPPPICDTCLPQNPEPIVEMKRLMSRPAPPQFVGGSKATSSMRIQPKK